MTAASDDPALDVLFLPLQDGALAWPPAERTLFLRARPGPALFAQRAHQPVCEQGFRPWAAALERDGFRMRDAGEDRFPLVLLLPTRQRDESRALLARAIDCLEPGGSVVACAGNQEGGRSLQDDLARLAGDVQHASKRHCRVAWCTPSADRIDAGLLAQWREIDAPRPIADGRYVSRPGLFAWDRIDAASALLAAAVAGRLVGEGADLGAGYGYLAAEVLASCPRVTRLDLYEAEARALALARVNLADARVPVGFEWHDVTTGLPGRYDFVVSNPPFHQRRADEPDLGRAFIAAAAAALRPGGKLWLVANRHLPYEQTLAQWFASSRIVREEGGFKVIEATKAGK